MSKMNAQKRNLKTRKLPVNREPPPTLSAETLAEVTGGDSFSFGASNPPHR